VNDPTVFRRDCFKPNCATTLFNQRDSAGYSHCTPCVLLPASHRTTLGGVKIADSRSAARRTDWTIEPGAKYKIPVEPADPGPKHAWLYSADPDDALLRSPKDVAQLRRWILAQPGTALLEEGFVEAACGTSLRVVYRTPFDTDQDNACPKCVSMARLRQTNPSEYDRLVRERHERWAERNMHRYEEIDAADLERQEGYGTDPIEDEDNELT
jgi:hypothetical protein